MKFIKYIICSMALVLGLASCSVTRYKAYAPNITQLSIQMDDLVYLGETTISVEYRTYFGITCIIDKINEVAYDGVEIKKLPIVNSGMNDKLLPKLNKASFKLIEEYPNADYFVVVNQAEEREHLFMGSSTKAKAKVKAYSFK